MILVPTHVHGAILSQFQKVCKLKPIDERKVII